MRSILLIAILTLTGCAGKRPEPVTFNSAPEIVSTNAFPNGPEWNAFKDPVDNLVRVALANNCDVRVTLTKVEKNRATVRLIEIHPVRNTP
jgi:hypothetical protein